MSLRIKTLLIVALVLSTLLVAMFCVSRTMLRGRFAEVERQEAQQAWRRSAAVIASSLEDVDAICHEWSRGGQSATEKSLDSLNLNVRGSFGEGGEPTSLMAWNGGTDSVERFPPGLSEYIRDHRLTLSVGPRGARGIVLVPAEGEGEPRAMLLSAYPITTDGHGLLVMGRWLDAQAVARVAQASAVMLSLAPAGEQGAATDLTGQGGAMVINGIGSGVTQCSAVVKDMVGTTGLKLSCYSQSLVTDQATMAARHVGIALLAAGLASTVLVFVLLGWLVLGRLASLSRDLDGISKGERGRVDVSGKDEVSRVGLAVNRTLEALDRSHAKIVESESRFRSMAHSSPLGVYLCAADGTVLYVNPACEAMVGQSAAAITRHGAWRTSVHEADRERVLASWSAAIAAGKPFREHYRVRHADGRELWLTSHAAPIVHEGEISGFVGTVEDTTARLKAQEDMRRAKQEAEAASSAKTEFLANMSHEIRTPMTAILGFADLLAEPGQTEADRLGCVETIRRNGEHLLAIINDILDISRIEAGRMTVEMAETSPWDVMNEVALLLRPRGEAKGVALNVDLEGPAPARLRSDPLRLRQALVNLVGNAVKFTDSGSVRLIMRTERADGAAPPAAWLCIDVIDSGIGISPEQMSRLFKPFSQGDGSMARRYGGTGLGLSISAKLAAMLGGEIRAASEPGRGSTFTLRLPVETLDGVAMLTPESAPRPQSKPGRPAAYVASSRGGTGAALSGKILLAEDGPDNQRLISFMLLRAGAHVEVAENGRAAVEMTLAAVKDKAPYDVILMDMQMPEMDGYAATRALRERGYKGPIVALTAHAMADDRAKCLAAGCDEFLTKPVTREGLTAACARWMARTVAV